MFIPVIPFHASSQHSIHEYTNINKHSFIVSKVLPGLQSQGFTTYTIVPDNFLSWCDVLHGIELYPKPVVNHYRIHWCGICQTCHGLCCPDWPSQWPSYSHCWNNIWTGSCTQVGRRFKLKTLYWKALLSLVILLPITPFVQPCYNCYSKNTYIKADKLQTSYILVQTSYMLQFQFHG